MNLREHIMRPGFTKHYVEGLPVAAVFHLLSEPDTADSIHDHPFSFTSFVISGGYVERVYIPQPRRFTFAYRDFIREPGTSHRVEANTIHQIIALPNGECHTLILPEEKTQEPGFYRFEDGKMYHRFRYESEYRLLTFENPLDTVVTRQDDKGIRVGYENHFTDTDLIVRGVKSLK